MSFIDIGIIVIVALCALIGLKKGLFKSTVSFFGWILSIVIAVFLTKIVAYALLDIGAIKNFVLGGGGGFSLFKWTSSWMPAPEEAPAFLQTIIAPIVDKVSGLAAHASFSVAEGLALFVTYYMFCAMVLIVLFILIRIVFALLAMFIKSFDKGEKPSGISRLLGFVVSAAQGVMYVCILLLMFTFVGGLPQLATVSEEIDKSMFAKPLYSVVQDISSKFLTSDDDDTFNKLVTLSGHEIHEVPAEESAE